MKLFDPRAAFVRFVIAIVACFTAACSESGPDVAKNVNLGRFEGRWYEIARVPRDYDAHCQDTVADYRRISATQLDLRHTCFLDSPTGPKHELRATATADDPSVPAKLSLQIGTYTGAYWVLDVPSDYRYAVIGHPSRTMLWVLSRRPTLSEADWNGALGLATKQGFDTDMLRRTPQSSSSSSR